MSVTIVKINEFLNRHTEHVHGYTWADRTGSGFSFPSNEDGVVDEALLQPAGRESLIMCRSGGATRDGKFIKLIDNGHESWTWDVRTCDCGSGEPDEWLYDGHNIALCLVCSECKEEKMKGYQPWVFSSYTEEQCECPIEPEEEVG